MTRCSRALLLLAVLLWQSLSMLGSTAVAQQVGELEHLMVHCQNATHHHHADDALHLDDHGDEGKQQGDGPTQHLHADSGTNTAGLLTSSQAFLGTARPLVQPETRPALWQSITLAGPLRPPMRRA